MSSSSGPTMSPLGQGGGGGKITEAARLKKPHGRPRVAPGMPSASAKKGQPKEDPPPPTAESPSRSSGRMSLRPNRRVKVHFSHVTQEESVWTDGEDEDERRIDDNDDGDDDLAAATAIDEVLRDADFLPPKTDPIGPGRGRGRGRRRRRGAGGQMGKAGEKTARGKRSAKKRGRDDNDDSDDMEAMNDLTATEKALETDYATCSDWVCVLCAREKSSTEESRHDLYTSRTQRNQSVYEVFRTLTNQDVTPTCHGSRLCPACYDAVNQLESLYVQFRRAAERLADTFLIGQQMLEADARGCQKAPAPVPADRTRMSDYINLSRCILKVIEPNHVGFNALSLGPSNFQVTEVRQYSAFVGAAGDFPAEVVTLPNGQSRPRVSDEALNDSDGDGSSADVHVLTLRYDADTGAIENAEMQAELDPNWPLLYLTQAELSSDAVDPNLPVLYLTQDELDSVRKSVTPLGATQAPGRLFIDQNDLHELECRLFLGHRVVQQILLSRKVWEAYETQNPMADSDFTCSDCHSSFDYFHMLTNHIQLEHVVAAEDVDAEASRRDEDELVRLAGKRGVAAAAASASALPTNLELKRTGEQPTLSKPFQCEHCDKCFSEYVILSTHIDHYHGFSRACNIDGCGQVLNSIQKFVLHYGQHANPSLLIPTAFREKARVVLPCPMCNVHIQGVWKYFQHTYTHDREARFKCPVCGKRVHKVQNFKEHLSRHRGGGAGAKQCPHCGKDFETSGELFSHVQLEHPYNYQPPQKQHQIMCNDCGKTFSNLHKLNYHKEGHLPKEQWKHLCGACDTSFPSNSRLKLHIANVHNNASSACELCGRSFPNKHQLQLHLQQQHAQQHQQQQPEFDDAPTHVIIEGVGVAADEILDPATATPEPSLFECLLCKIREPTLLDARKHCRLVHPDLPFTCPLCKESFTLEDELHQHLTGFHPAVVASASASADNAYPCVHCEKSFSQPSMLLRHTRFVHLTETIDLADMSTGMEEISVMPQFHIAERDASTDSVIKLHSIP